MNLKLGKTLLVVTAILVLSYGYMETAKASENWENLYPERFDTLEQFFLQKRVPQGDNAFPLS